MTVLLMFGNAYLADFIDAESTQRVEDLQSLLLISKYSTNRMMYLSWVKYFYEGEGKRSPHQVDSLLAYWQSYFVFPSPPRGRFEQFRLPDGDVAGSGKRLALTPWHLGVMYLG